MAKTFDEAIAKVGTYLKNNDLSNSDNNDKFFYIILNDLRKKYAPTIEMTKEAYNELNKLRSHNYDLDVVNSRAMFEYNPLKQYTTEELAQAWLHPDTIKLVGHQHSL